MAKSHPVNEGSDNVFIAVPKNLFVLLIAGILIIAAVLVYQFIYIPAKETALEKAAEMRAAAIQAKQTDEAITAAKKDIALAYSHVGIKVEPVLHTATSLKGLDYDKASLRAYNEFDGPKQILVIQWNKMFETDETYKEKKDEALFVIKVGEEWRSITGNGQTKL